jgi:hypothetical protein
LLQANVDRPPHFAFTLPPRLALLLTHGWAQNVVRPTTRLCRLRLAFLLIHERLPQALQLEDQRRALRAQCVLVRIVEAL